MLIAAHDSFLFNFGTSWVKKTVKNIFGLKTDKIFDINVWPKIERKVL